MAPGLRRIPLPSVDWSSYDVVKAVFHRGFQTVEDYGGVDHPFIITKLGSVVGAEDIPGIYFYGEQRERLFALQKKISAASRFVTVLSRQAGDLWHNSVSRDDDLLLVPGGVDRDIPKRGADPYPSSIKKRCVFAGNIYSRTVQPEAHQVLVEKLNRLGRALREQGTHLFFLGVGDTDTLDSTAVTSIGSVEYEKSWQYLFHASVGIVVSAGDFMHNNESTKIYHYLRAGLPVVCEAGFPNDHVVHEAGLGFVVDDHEMNEMASKAEIAISTEWNREHAIKYILENHTWDARTDIYHELMP